MKQGLTSANTTLYADDAMKHQPKVGDAIIAFRTNNVFKAAAVGLAKREDMTLTQLCRKAIRQYIVRKSSAGAGFAGRSRGSVNAPE